MLQFSRKWDDQLAVTIPAAMEDHTRAWDIRLHNISLMIRHNFCYDGKVNEKYNYRKPIKWWKNEGRYAWEVGRLLCDQCVLDVT